MMNIERGYGVGGIVGWGEERRVDSYVVCEDGWLCGHVKIMHR